MDYLSFWTLRKLERLSVPCYGANLLVLNSVNNFAQGITPRLKAYKHIYCYLDNDDAGRRVVDMLRELKGDAVHDMMGSLSAFSKTLMTSLSGRKRCRNNMNLLISQNLQFPIYSECGVKYFAKRMKNCFGIFDGLG